MFLDNNDAKNIDSESIIFWKDELPYLDFVETDVITFRGANILKMRPEIDNKTMINYIRAFYRHFPAETFTKIIRESSVNQIKRLSYTNNKQPLVLNNEISKPTNPSDVIPFNYVKSKEIGAFHKPNTMKILAYLVLSETYPKSRIPFDLIEANIFFNENFKDSKKEVFNKCCSHHGLKPEEVLLHYSNTIKCIDYYPTYNNIKNKTRTIDILANVFMQITK